MLWIVPLLLAPSAQYICISHSHAHRFCTLGSLVEFTSLVSRVDVRFDEGEVGRARFNLCKTRNTFDRCCVAECSIKIKSRLVCVFVSPCERNRLLCMQKHSLSRLSLPRGYFSALFCQVHFLSCPLPLVYFPGNHHHHQHHHLLHFAVSSADHGRSPHRQRGSGQSRETMKCQLLTPSSAAYLAASRSSWAIYPACQNTTNNGILHNVAILPGK